MRIDEYQQKSNNELRGMADECFRRMDVCGPLDRPALLLEAQFYMNEIGQRDDARIAKRDFMLELIVIALICFEIIIAFVEGYGQEKILSHMDTSTAATAATMTDLQKAQHDSVTALIKLTDEQMKALVSLDQMNSKLQASVSKTGDMAVAAQQQLKIAQTAESNRQTELARKPKLEIFIGTVPLNSVISVPVKETELTATKATYDFILRNSGDASATKGILRMIVFAKDVTLQCSSPFERLHEDQLGNPQHAIVVPFDFVRP